MHKLALKAIKTLQLHTRLLLPLYRSCQSLITTLTPLSQSSAYDSSNHLNSQPPTTSPLSSSVQTSRTINEIAQPSRLVKRPGPAWRSSTGWAPKYLEPSRVPAGCFYSFLPVAHRNRNHPVTDHIRKKSSYLPQFSRKSIFPP